LHYSRCTQILISFVTVLNTVNTQFRIGWPLQFGQTLALLSLFSFDLSAIANVFQVSGLLIDCE
jgi:hypothetical protein